MRSGIKHQARWPQSVPGRDVVVAHSGVQHSADLALAIEEKHRLLALATGLQVGSGSPLVYRLGPISRRLERRRTSLHDTKIVRLRPIETIFARAAGRFLPGHLQDAVNLRIDERFITALVRGLPTETRLIISTDLSSSELFRHLKEERPDVKRVLDVSHPIDAVRQALVLEDADRWGLSPQAYDDYRSDPPLDQTEELELADLVIVASSFSASLLPHEVVAPDKIGIVPYGVLRPEAPRLHRHSTGRKLLFVGALSERKGITLLLRAFTELHDADSRWQLTLIGRDAGTYRLPDPLPEGVEHRSGLTNLEVQDALSQADLLVLPSMCEGFGRVLLESIALGTPVLATETSGAPDILARCPSAPVTLLKTVERDRLSAFIDQAAHRTWGPDEFDRATNAFSSENYASRLAELLGTVD